MTLKTSSRLSRQMCGTGQEARTRRRVRVLGYEQLEDRQLLSSSGDTFAHFAGNGTSRGGHDTVAMQVRSSDFTLPKRRVILGFALETASTSERVQMQMLTHQLTQAHVILHVAHPVGANGVMLASAGTGSFNVLMGTPKGTIGQFQLNVFLAGDANGDHRVDTQDLSLIRSMLGVRLGDPRYNPAADPDRDGRITLRDLSLARLNLGASTQVRTLSVTVGLDPASNPDGNGIVTQSDVAIDGRTEPGATVLLFQGPNSSVPRSTTADAQGSYEFQITTPIGQTPLRVVATDSFGQSSTASTTVQHGDVVIAWDQTML